MYTVPTMYCYGHALNLAVQDTVTGIKVMEDTLNIVYGITKLIKKSPKHDAIFQKTKNEIACESPGVRILCPTQWTVCTEALASISESYCIKHYSLPGKQQKRQRRIQKWEQEEEDLLHKWRNLFFFLSDRPWAEGTKHGWQFVPITANWYYFVSMWGATKF